MTTIHFEDSGMVTHDEDLDQVKARAEKALRSTYSKETWGELIQDILKLERELRISRFKVKVLNNGLVNLLTKPKFD